jgi:hypothetical protein
VATGVSSSQWNMARRGGFLHCLSQNISFVRIPVGCREWCSAMLPLGFLSPSSAFSPHPEETMVNIHYNSPVALQVASDSSCISLLGDIVTTLY